MVMGIIGKTQGVNMAAKPNPKATSMKLRVPLLAMLVSAAPGGDSTCGWAALGRVLTPGIEATKPVGMESVEAMAELSTSRVAVAVLRTGGRHNLSVQT